MGNCCCDIGQGGKTCKTEVIKWQIDFAFSFWNLKQTLYVSINANANGLHLRLNYVAIFTQTNRKRNCKCTLQFLFNIFCEISPYAHHSVIYIYMSCVQYHAHTTPFPNRGWEHSHQSMEPGFRCQMLPDLVWLRQCKQAHTKLVVWIMRVVCENFKISIDERTHMFLSLSYIIGKDSELMSWQMSVIEKTFRM